MKKMAMAHMALVALMFTTACSKSEAKGSSEKGPQVSATRIPKELGARLDNVLKIYDSIRGLLARDDVAAATRDAATLARAAASAASMAPKHLHASLQQVEKAANQLQKVDKSNADTVRRSFGEVSRAVIALFSAEPTLQEGYYVFECPMAQGYKKWVQTSAKISNPYMGTRMLECGAQTQWKIIAGPNSTRDGR